VGSGRDTRHAEAQHEGVQYQSKGTGDISRGEIIMACDVQSFSATIRVRTSRKAEEAIPM